MGNSKIRHKQKKDKKYRESIMKIESNERKKKRARDKNYKACKKQLRSISNLQARFESYWLWQWCCPVNYTGHRIVTRVDIEFSSRKVFVYFEGGVCYRVFTQSGGWPVKSDLDVLEVGYNEEGNILPKLQAENRRVA